MTHLHSQTLRIIDANLNRTAEGLRVMEDVSRFCLNSPDMSLQLKAQRHRLLENVTYSTPELLSARNSAGDVGRKTQFEKTSAGSLCSTVSANARRAEQSLRVLEEMARLPGSGIDGIIIEEIRYAVYTLEKELVSHISRQYKTNRLAGQYLILTINDESSLSFPDDAGIVQLDPGNSKRGDFLTAATEAADSCKRIGAMFIVGEFADIAVAAKADGVAVDGGSLPPAVLRGLLGIDQLIGFSAANIEQAIEAEKSGVDYLMCSGELKNRLAKKVAIPIVVPDRSHAV
ncbi:thiamin-phosphate pyrophosphorylase [Dehalogenimonas sp. WBC-2]|nr:thiamin-phosphate pyrophosphorylase [Dehalogenimonas sp. WBC-2]